MENNEIVLASTGTRLTVVDWGNMAVKYIGTDSRGSFSSRISNDYQAYEEGFQRIEIDGRISYFEIGELQKEYNKCEKDFIPQLLYSICRGNNKEEIIETNLSLLLPTIQMQNKPKLIEKLKNKEFSFKYNGKDRVVKIMDVMILPEGYISYFSLSDEDKTGSIAIIDIGSRTVNLAVLHNGKVEKLNTVKLGSYDFYSKIKNIENAKGEDFIEEDIQRLIDESVIKIYQKQYAEFLNEILNSIKSYVNLKTYKCIFTGGTSLMLQEYISKLPLPSFKIHEDALNSNVNGALEASKLAWEVA
jgi:plasmid segregation protein ParM